MNGAIGVDIVDVDRVRRLAERWGDRFLRRIFTEFIRGSTDADAPQTARPLSLCPPEVERRLSSLWARDPWSKAPGGQEGDAMAGGMQEALDRTVDDCLARIRQERSTVQREALRRALAAADRAGDPEGLLRLLAEHPSVKRAREAR